MEGAKEEEYSAGKPLADFPCTPCANDKSLDDWVTLPVEASFSALF